MANSSHLSFVRTVGRVVRHEWIWLGLLSMVVSLTIMLSLYGANPRFHEVWQYTPAAIPTLSFVESVMHQAPVVVPSNHATWLSVWVLQQAITTPKWIVIIVYGMASVLTACFTYIALRGRDIAISLALIGAIAFALLPARFVQPTLAHQWWLGMPLVLWWGLSWWDIKRHPIDWVWAGVTGILLAFSGDTLWFWSSMVLVSFAVIAYLMHRTWHSILAATSMIVFSFGLMRLCYYLWPMPMMTGDAGIRLSGLWIPSADHRISMLGQFGRDFVALDVVHTDIAYIGLFALLGLGIAVIFAVMRSVGAGPVIHVHRLLLVASVLIIVANQRGFMLAIQFLGLPPLSSLFVDVWLALIGITVVLMVLQSRPVSWWLAGLICLIIIIDHLPRTNIMDQMMQRTISIPTSSWRDGVWFGQGQQSPDVVVISGVGDVEPGFGRWSDADIADHVEVVLAEPIVQPLTLEIRARGVGVNVGAPVIIQIGDEQQSMVLTTTVATYQLTFSHGSGAVIAIYPQPVTTPPPGDSRRIGVFMQSIRVVTP